MYHEQDDRHFCSEEVEFFNFYLNVKDYRPDNIIDVSEKIYF